MNQEVPWVWGDGAWRGYTPEEFKSKGFYPNVCSVRCAVERAQVAAPLVVTEYETMTELLTAVRSWE